MNKFGVLKTKMLTKLTESYSQENKKEVKDILNTIKENKDFKEMYLFYEDIENKYISDKETAKLYVEGLSTMLKDNMSKLSTFCESLDTKLGDVKIENNELYESLDTLTQVDTLSNIEKKVIAKQKLVEHLTTKKEILESKDSTLVPNESLLQAVLANNFNVLYSNTLSESQKEELKNILSIPHDELTSKVTDLKESILTNVETLMTESKEEGLVEKLLAVKNEVNTMSTSKYNYYKLLQLKDGLN